MWPFKRKPNRIDLLEAEVEELRGQCKRFALDKHGYNVGDLERCVEHDLCLDWRVHRDYGPLSTPSWEEE